MKGWKVRGTHSLKNIFCEGGGFSHVFMHVSRGAWRVCKGWDGQYVSDQSWQQYKAFYRGSECTNFGEEHDMIGSMWWQGDCCIHYKHIAWVSVCGCVRLSISRVGRHMSMWSRYLDNLGRFVCLGGCVRYIDGTARVREHDASIRVPWRHYCSKER